MGVIGYPARIALLKPCTQCEVITTYAVRGKEKKGGMVLRAL